jgi:hypothetical protein
MSILQTGGLLEPAGTDKISQGTLGYICTRNRQRQYDLVIREFKKSGLTQAVLARRLGKSPEVVNRLLARPGNWEADTFAELMFGISGAVPGYRADYPLRRAETTASQQAAGSIKDRLSVILADLPKGIRQQTATGTTPNTNIVYLSSKAA